MVTWNNEILMKLFDRNDNHVLIEKLSEIYFNEINYEFHLKLYELLGKENNNNKNIDFNNIKDTDYKTNSIINKIDFYLIKMIIGSHNNENYSFSFLEK